jgi:hypothetical protein
MGKKKKIWKTFPYEHISFPSVKAGKIVKLAASQTGPDPNPEGGIEVVPDH